MDMSTFQVLATPSQTFLLKTKPLNLFQTPFFFKKSWIQEYNLYCAGVISIGRIRILLFLTQWNHKETNLGQNHIKSSRPINNRGQIEQKDILDTTWEIKPNSYFLKAFPRTFTFYLKKVGMTSFVFWIRNKNWSILCKLTKLVRCNLALKSKCFQVSRMK